MRQQYLIENYRETTSYFKVECETWKKIDPFQYKGFKRLIIKWIQKWLKKHNIITIEKISAVQQIKIEADSVDSLIRQVATDYMKRYGKSPTHIVIGCSEMRELQISMHYMVTVDVSQFGYSFHGLKLVLNPHISTGIIALGDNELKH